jgi:CPA2 family monovalent cation:H+ antiporter-2
VLFFVSVGMLFSPEVLWTHPLAVVATVAIILIGKSVAAYGIVRAFGYSNRTGLLISASLAQVGEFSFILAGLGVALGLLPEEGRDLILAGAIISILLNPVAFDFLERWKGIGTAPARPGSVDADAEPAELEPITLTDHAIVVGYGRVGSLVGEALVAADLPIVVIEDNPEVVAALRARKIDAFVGNGVRDEVMAAANLPAAKWLLVAIPEAYEASQIVRHARALNAQLTIVARAHFDAQVEMLTADGATAVIMGEREIARGMVERVLSTEAKPGA